jgi:chromosome segregation ATPase
MADDDKLTQYRLAAIEETLSAIRDSLAQLTALEQKHHETRQALDRAFSSIKSQDERIKSIELEIPTLKLTRGWILSVVVGVGALLGAAIFKLVVH